MKHQLLDDIIENEKRGLTGRAESLRGFYDSYIENFYMTDKLGRRYNYDGGYDEKTEDG